MSTPDFVVLYGPQGCGKSYHAESIRQYFKLDYIAEEVCVIHDEIKYTTRSIHVQKAPHDWMQRGRALVITSSESQALDIASRLYSDTISHIDVVEFNALPASALSTIDSK